VTLSVDPQQQPSVWGRPADWEDFPFPAPPDEPPAPVAPSRHRRLVAFIALAIVAAVVAAVLATRSAGVSAATPLKSAAARSEAQRSVAFTATTTVMAGAQALTVERLAGQTDFHAHVGQFSVEVDAGATGTVRYFGMVAYVQYPALDLSGGGQWVQLNATDMASGPAAAAALGGGDPTRSLRLLEGVVGRPTVVGSESVDGTATTHYRALLDVDAATGSRGLPRLTADVWLDAAGRVRRLDYQIDSTLRGAPTVNVESLRLTSFGAAVGVVAPPSDQVVPFALVADRWQQFLASGAAGPGFAGGPGGVSPG
jgi:hypothetical protein